MTTIRLKSLFLAALLIQMLLVSCATSVTPASVAPIPVPQLPAPTETIIPPTPTVTPNPPTPTSQPTTVPPPFSGGTSKLNIDELMPPAPGREPVLFYCINCHTIAPIVITRWTETEWTAFVNMYHRDRVPVSEREWDQMLNYLITNFPPNRPVPQLPPELLTGWTGDWFE